MADGGNTRIVITKPGVLAFGEGLPAGPSIASIFQDETVIQVSCGQDQSAVVCESGLVYTFGRNQDTEWWETDENTVDEPRLFDTLSRVRIVQAACGYRYTMLLADTGELYSCGSNGQGQLGLGHRDNVPTPVLVTGLPPIKKVGAGYSHTVVLSDSGVVWVCGRNDYGQLGLGHRDKQISFTRVPDLPEPIIDISCGAHHTALISGSRVLLMTGWNGYGQLGLGDIDSLSRFKPVSVSSTALAAVSCGYYHTVALGANSTIWAWGFNNAGQLGTGDTTRRNTPTEMIGLEGQTVSQVIAGSNHTAVLTQEGDVLVCGRGRSGALGRGNKNISVATLLPKSSGLVIQQVAFADTYSLMLVVPPPYIPSALQLQVGVNEQGDQAKSCTTNWEQNIMRSLECPVCFKIMCAPIHLCIKGHSLCGSCRSDTNTTVCPLCREEFTKGRNIALESLSAETRLPCTECLQRMPVSELEKHGEVCPERKYSCPVRQPCGWSGRPETMLAHTSSAHPDQTWRDLPHLFAHSTSDELIHTDVLAVHDQVFTLHRRYDKTAKRFQAAVRYIGAPENRLEFMYEFTFVLVDMTSTSYCRNVCSDIESIEDTFQSSNCVSIKNEVVDSFLLRGRLVCRVAIFEVGTRGLAAQIKALIT